MKENEINKNKNIDLLKITINNYNNNDKHKQQNDKKLEWKLKK